MSEFTTARMRVTRDHIFSFAAWLLWQRASIFNSTESRGIEPAYSDVFERLFSLFPAEPRGAQPSRSLYASLSTGADPEQLWQFVMWLYERATAGPGLNEHPQGANWGYARNWSEFERIVKAEEQRPPTAVLPNPWITKVTPKDGWDALEALRERRRGSNDLVLEAAIEQWRRLTLRLPYDSPCPACTTVRINPLIASHHLPHCQSNPAVASLRAADDLLQIAPVVAARAAPAGPVTAATLPGSVTGRAHHAGSERDPRRPGRGTCALMSAGRPRNAPDLWLPSSLMGRFGPIRTVTAAGNGG